MEFFENELYHIYNRGNNQQQIFFKPDNYLYFLKKVRKFILPYCDILAYCLTPNHFHFQISADSRTIATKEIGNQYRLVLSEGIRNLLQTCTKNHKQTKQHYRLFVSTKYKSKMSFKWQQKIRLYMYELYSSKSNES